VAGKLSADRAARILRGIRSKGASARLRRQLASEVLRDVRTLDRKIADLNGRIGAEVEASGTALRHRPHRDLRRRAHTGREDLGDCRRCGTLPDQGPFRLLLGHCAGGGLESGKVVRHRLSLAGNRKLNYALHMVATSQARSDAPGGTYYRKKLDEGKSRKEALRCLKRRVSDAVYKSLLADSQAPSRSAA
jgi:transposase